MVAEYGLEIIGVRGQVSWVPREYFSEEYGCVLKGSPWKEYIFFGMSTYGNQMPR